MREKEEGGAGDRVRQRETAEERGCLGYKWDGRLSSLISVTRIFSLSLSLSLSLFMSVCLKKNDRGKYKQTKS